ncbi:hypothetical protein BP1258A_2922 [Burkholderia pseudomallei 1258a]|nr:hypothetical protein BP1258A_2922 [Burkholderia pseudomallei 1258a]EIF62274.1 hypothetical protein BP1258B_3296 [Burkholderia pseudomallei 1258b]EIF68407.1 hypothetical protein BP354E_6151 [Burkholderia pseudomallei 354e]EIF79337.1 hypothetical protein BP354A_3428 [Burkholderia pseudomallei 354a]
MWLPAANVVCGGLSDWASRENLLRRRGRACLSVVRLRPHREREQVCNARRYDLRLRILAKSVGTRCRHAAFEGDSQSIAVRILDKLCFQRIFEKIDVAVDSKLSHGIGFLRANGLLASLQAVGNFIDRQPGCKQAYDFYFPWR